MGIERLPLAVRLGLYGLAAAILLYLCLAPGDALPSVHLWDKAEHATAWAVLTAVGLILFPRRAGAVAAFSLAFGAAVEVLQAILPSGRDADWKDFAADAVGVAIVLLAWAAIRRTRAHGP